MSTNVTKTDCQKREISSPAFDPTFLAFSVRKKRLQSFTNSIPFSDPLLRPGGGDLDADPACHIAAADDVPVE